VFYSIFYSAQREKDMREGVTGAGNCLVYAPFDVGDNPLMSFGLLQCISFGSLGSFCQLNFISLFDSLEFEDIIFFGGSLFICLGWGNCSRIRNWAGQIHASIANSPVWAPLDI